VMFHIGCHIFTQGEKTTPVTVNDLFAADDVSSIGIARWSSIARRNVNRNQQPPTLKVEGGNSGLNPNITYFILVDVQDPVELNTFRHNLQQHIVCDNDKEGTP
ncbi:hypothetical protein LSAT2_031826, partial [Lamellibrachia satsuma]